LKFEAVKVTEIYGNRRAAPKFMFNPKQIQACRERHDLNAWPLDEVLAEHLLEWIHERRLKGLQVSRMLRRKPVIIKGGLLQAGVKLLQS